MCDTFHPLKLTKFAKDLDADRYAYSWYEDASGVGLTSHFQARPLPKTAFVLAQ
jgi:hypothetical protein